MDRWRLKRTREAKGASEPDTCSFVIWIMKRGPTRIETSPSSFSTSPSSAEIREDFPQPTWPTTANREPCGTITLMLQTHGAHSHVRGSAMTIYKHETSASVAYGDLLVQNGRVLFRPGEFPVDDCHRKLC